jgi:hypothetical protein
MRRPYDERVQKSVSFSVMGIPGNDEAASFLDAIMHRSQAHYVRRDWSSLRPHCSHTLGTRDQRLGSSSGSDNAPFPAQDPFPLLVT